ncbi:hypothetical protein SCOR_24945 [Sulfidibacter corallicola]|uniref:Uncharacterized protein n=1 Tax=Sulfidibacter corallicola TaxID=2818388 RepID=A0A8A4TQU2_SULCO|nr:hypothetical protein [Sulfidibacter corallicola]QTD52346.1 hypothetical protein J3U87_07710 [Sulfidibacter corallicola]
MKTIFVFLSLCFGLISSLGLLAFQAYHRDEIAWRQEAAHGVLATDLAHLNQCILELNESLSECERLPGYLPDETCVDTALENWTTCATGP